MLAIQPLPRVAAPTLGQHPPAASANPVASVAPSVAKTSVPITTLLAPWQPPPLDKRRLLRSSSLSEVLQLQAMPSTAETAQATQVATVRLVPQEPLECSGCGLASLPGKKFCGECGRPVSAWVVVVWL